MMWSKWSHSAILDHEHNMVYDAAMLQGGVKKHDFHTWIKKYPDARHVEYRLIEVKDIKAARAWLEAQRGKKYDWTAVVAFPFRQDWRCELKWFCSEMTEAFRTLFSKPIFRADASRITPHHQDIVI